jgi:hypothetical protein
LEAACRHTTKQYESQSYHFHMTRVLNMLIMFSTYEYAYHV